MHFLRLCMYIDTDCLTENIPSTYATSSDTGSTMVAMPSATPLSSLPTVTNITDTPNADIKSWKHNIPVITAGIVYNKCSISAGSHGMVAWEFMGCLQAMGIYKGL